jgi:DMSO/TMAO reductase YedYZ molybdopterin-dependent catalytic subunit
MNTKPVNLSFILTVLMLVIAAFYGFNQLSRLGQTDYVEVREYQGARLSSINDFRENSIKGPQDVNVTDYRLKIYGLVESSIEYTYQEVLEDFISQKKVVTLNCVEGWSATILWEGVRVTDLIEKANPSEDSKIIIFHAEDGYTTSLPIDYIKENDLIIAYKINEVTLPNENGFPFQLVAESKWGYKWCRWITALEIGDDADFEGYWEQRGYSNTADLDDSFWGK